MFTDADGLPCLTGRNICDGRVNYERADVVSEQEYEIFKRFQIKDGDTLITLKGKGSIGKIGFVINCRKSIFSRNIGIIRPKSISPSYLNAYLLSEYGQILIQRGETGGTGQSTLTCTYIKNIDVPRFNIEDRIGEFILLAETILLKSQNVYLEAEKVLLRELGLSDWDPTNQTSTTKSFADFLGSGRLDAEYYQPKYATLRNKLISYKHGYYILSEIAKTYRGDLISDTLYTTDNTGIAYIRGTDISSNILTDDKCVYIDKSFIPINETRCKRNDLIFALIGSVGTVARVTDGFIGSFISNNLGLIRLNSDADISPEYLHILLTCPRIGKYLFEQKEMRTAQPKISDKDIFDFIIPKIDRDIQQQIVDKVHESFALRKKSKHLLDLAKTAVEIAIEQGEQKALELLKQN